MFYTNADRNINTAKTLVILASAKIILPVTTISDTAMKDNYQKLLFL